MQRWPVRDDEVNVWCVRLDSDPSTFESAFATLSEDERKRTARFLVPSAKATFVLARAVLRTLAMFGFSVPARRRYRNILSRADRVPLRR